MMKLILRCKVNPLGSSIQVLCTLFNDNSHFQAYTLIQYLYTVRIRLNLTFYLDLPRNVHLLNVHLTDKHFFYQKENRKHSKNVAKRGSSYPTRRKNMKMKVLFICHGRTLESLINQGITGQSGA